MDTFYCMGCCWWCIHSHLYKNIPNRENSFNITFWIFFFFTLITGWISRARLPTHPPTATLSLDLAEQTFVMKSAALLWSSPRAEFRPSVPIATRDLSAVKQEVPLNPCVNGFDPWTLSHTASQSDAYPSVKPCSLQRATRLAAAISSEVAYVHLMTTAHLETLTGLVSDNLSHREDNLSASLWVFTLKTQRLEI